MHPAGEGEHDCSFVCSFSLTRGGGKETKMPIKHRGRKGRGRLGKLAALLIISMALGSISRGKLYADFAMEVEPGEVPLVNDRTGHAPTAAERRERKRLAQQEQAEEQREKTDAEADEPAEGADGAPATESDLAAGRGRATGSDLASEKDRGTGLDRATGSNLSALSGAEFGNGGLSQVTVLPAGGEDDFCYGGAWSIYQESGHRLNGGHLVESFVMMETGDGTTVFADPEEYAGDGYAVTFCADEPADMYPFVDVMHYRRVPLSEADCFTDAQRTALAVILPAGYPYVGAEIFRERLREAGVPVSASCGEEEMLAGMQAAIYCITNPRSDGEAWGYESSDPEGSRWFSVKNTDGRFPEATESDLERDDSPAGAGQDAKNGDPTSGDAETEDAEASCYDGRAAQDVNLVRDYLLSLARPRGGMLKSPRNPVIPKSPRNPVIPKAPQNPVTPRGDGSGEPGEDSAGESGTAVSGPELREVESLSIIPVDNGDGTWKAVAQGELSREVRESSTGYRERVTVQLLCTDKDGNPLKDYMSPVIPVAAGEKHFLAELEGLPADAEVTFVCTVHIIDNEVYVYYPEGAGKEGWQIQIGAGGGNFYRELYERTESIPVRKEWREAPGAAGEGASGTAGAEGDTEGAAVYPAVTVRLLQDGKPYVLSDGSADGDSGGGMDGGTGGNTDGDSGGSGMKLVLSEENGWTGTFAHVPRERWSYTSYEASERTESLVRLSDHSYTVEEDVPEGFTAEVFAEKVEYPEYTDCAGLPAPGEKVVVSAGGVPLCIGDEPIVFRVKADSDAGSAGSSGDSVVLVLESWGAEYLAGRDADGRIVLEIPGEGLWLSFADADGNGRIDFENMDELLPADSAGEAGSVTFRRKELSKPAGEGFLIVNRPKVPEEPEPEPASPSVLPDPGPGPSPDPDPEIPPELVPEPEPAPAPPAEVLPEPVREISSGGHSSGGTGRSSGLKGAGRITVQKSSPEEQKLPAERPPYGVLGARKVPQVKENSVLAGRRRAETGDRNRMFFWGSLCVLGLIDLIIFLLLRVFAKPAKKSLPGGGKNSPESRLSLRECREKKE